MAPSKRQYQYAVVGASGDLSRRYPMQSQFSNSRALANCAAEAFELEPDSAGVVWPLTFAIFNMEGRELCRYSVKRWLVPHYLVKEGHAAVEEKPRVPPWEVR